jgi:hypothetical protein
MWIFARPAGPTKCETVAKVGFCFGGESTTWRKTLNTAQAPEGAKIGSIGLGKMGLPIYERLAVDALPVTALTRSAEHRE